MMRWAGVLVLWLAVSRMALAADVFEALKTGSRDEVQKALDAGADPSARDAKGLTALHVAAMEGKGSAIRPLVLAGADMGARDAGGRTPLHLAAACWRPFLGLAVAPLLQLGADVNAVDGEGRTPLDAAFTGEADEWFPGGLRELADALLARGAKHTTLHAAAALGDTARVRELLGQGADPSARAENGLHPLDWVAWGWMTGSDEPVCRVEETKLLLEAKADPNTRDTFGMTPLHRAAAYSCPPVATLLLEHGAEVDARDKQGRTPLYVAVRGDAEVVRLLLKHGADVNVAQEHGRSALMDAVCCGDLEMVKALLEGGARVTEPWLLMGACGHDDSLERAKLLTAHGADPLWRYAETGTTLLHRAARDGDAGMARLALDAGIYVNARDRDGRTPLWGAMWSGFGSEIWKLLVAAGADPMIEDKEQLTVVDWAEFAAPGSGVPQPPEELRAKAAARNLHMAALHGDAEQVARFLEQGVDPNGRYPRDGRTPLHYAARLDHPDAAKVLLERGADVNARDDLGRTPLHETTLTGKSWTASEAIVDLLLSHGADATIADRKGKTPLDSRPWWRDRVPGKPSGPVG